MSVPGDYRFTFSAELQSYYKKYYGLYSTVDMADYTWVGVTSDRGSEITYQKLSEIFTFSSGQYRLSESIDSGRIYFFVPWKWSDKSLNGGVSHSESYDTLDAFFGTSAPNGSIQTIVDSGTQPALNRAGNSFPAPFAYVETNSGGSKTNNGDISLIDGYSLPLTIQVGESYSASEGPASVTSGITWSQQKALFDELKQIHAPRATTMGTSQNGVQAPWSYVAPSGSQEGDYSNLKSYLQYLADKGSTGASSSTAFLYKTSGGASTGSGTVKAITYFFKDGNGDPYIIVAGKSNNDGQKNGLWLLPWNASQLSGASKTAFASGDGANRGLSDVQSIYGNAGGALYVSGKQYTDLTTPGTLSSVISYFNANGVQSSYTGHEEFAGDLFIGLAYGLIGSTEKLKNASNLPSTASSVLPTGLGFGVGASTPIGKLPSNWWYANGSVFTSETGSFLGPIAKRQIGSDLWPGLGAGPYWDTYAVAIRENESINFYDSANGGGLVGPYAWPMDDRMGGNLVYFDTTGNWLNIDLGAPYTGENLVPSPSPSGGGGGELFEQVGFRSEESGRWSPPGSRLGSTYLTMFVSSSVKVTAIGGQDISLTNAEGAAIESSQFDSSNRTGGSLYQGLGTSLYEATSDAAFHAIAAKTEGRSIGANNLQLIEVPDQQFAVQAGSAASTQEATSVTDENGVWVTSFADQTSVAFSTGVFDLFGHTSPQTIKLLATSVGRNTNTLIAYRVDSITGAIANSDGSFVNPGETGYAEAAINSSLLDGDPLSLQFGQTKEGSFADTGSSELFALAIITNGTAEQFLAKNPSNKKSDGPQMFFSLGAANPDGKAHMASLDSGVIGFEDLWGGGDQDYNDVVMAFRNVPIAT